jgi:hypothetical protein
VPRSTSATGGTSATATGSTSWAPCWPPVGLVALVYGFSRAEQDGWGSGLTIGVFVAAVVLLAVFALVESRVKGPLLPLRVITERNRGGAYLSIGLAMIGMFGQFLFLTYFLQLNKGYSPVMCGVAFLPLVLCLVIGSAQIGTRLVNRVPARFLMGPGFLLAALGMLLLTQLEVDSSFATHVLPSEILLGLGMGTASMPGMSLATSRVRPQDAGVASAMINVSQQVGGSIGTALLNTVAASATSSWIAARAFSGAVPEAAAQRAAVHGYTVAFGWSTAIMALAALIAFVLVNGGGRRGVLPRRGRAAGRDPGRRALTGRSTTGRPAPPGRPLARRQNQPPQ